MKFDTVERCGRVYVIKNGIMSFSSVKQVSDNEWLVLVPRATSAWDTPEEALALIAEQMDDWYTVAQAAEMLVEMGIFDEPPSIHVVSKWAHEGLFPGAMKIRGKGGRGSGGAWRIPKAGLAVFAERRKEQ